MTETTEQNESIHLPHIEERLKKMRMTANWVGGSLIFLGIVAVAAPLLITVCQGQATDLTIRILAFASTLSITLIAAFNLPTKALDTRNGWKYLNTAVIAYKAKVVNTAELVKAYEISEALIGTVDFNYTKSNVKPITGVTPKPNHK